MSEAESADDTASITNYDVERGPHPLSKEDVTAGTVDETDAGTRPYYAIKREDGYVGINANSPRHTVTPKIRVLYVTGDGRWSFTLPHTAVETEDGREFANALTAVAVRQPRRGKRTAKRSIESFRELAHDLHDLGGGDGE